VRIGRGSTWLRLFSTPDDLRPSWLPHPEVQGGRASFFREPVCCSPPLPGVPCPRSRSLSRPQPFAQAKSPWNMNLWPPHLPK